MATDLVLVFFFDHCDFHRIIIPVLYLRKIEPWIVDCQGLDKAALQILVTLPTRPSDPYVCTYLGLIKRACSAKCATE